MRKSIHITLIVLILSSCGQKQDEKKKAPTKTTVESSAPTVKDYSEEFLKHFQGGEMTLKDDSIFLPKETGIEVIMIPNYIPKNQDVIFESEGGNSISIRQVNYTDLEFTIEYENQKFSGKASLFPHFYLGMESVGFSDGEYMINNYYVTETDNPCLDYIGLGNQNIAEENPGNVYALIAVSGDTCEDELNELTNKKLKTFANN